MSDYQNPRYVKHPPDDRHLLIFDGDCVFCRFWVDRWRSLISSTVDCLDSQSLDGRFPEISRQAFADSVVLIESTGKVTTGADAVFRALSRGANHHLASDLYRKSKMFARISDSLYSFVAKNRGLFSKATQLFWGASPACPTFAFSSWLLLRLVGCSFLVAFISLWTQIDGLIGDHGILPAVQFLHNAHAQFGNAAYAQWPGVFWLIGGTSTALVGVCAAGSAFAVFAIVGIAPALSFFFCWFFYWSLISVGQEFLSFQWDALLLEVGLLAALLAPWKLWVANWRIVPPLFPRILMVWLTVRLLFLSGYVKLTTGDANWAGKTALTYHYETQPLPTYLAWYAHHFPASVQRFSCWLMFAIELAVPFFLLGPRRLRHSAALAIIALQIAIGLTGNYTFFNFLTIALALGCCDDGFFGQQPGTLSHETLPWRARRLRGSFALILCGASILMFAFGLKPSIARFQPVAVPLRFFSILRSVNNYGLFAVMTTVRREIVIEGSDDGIEWQAYEFKWKPGDVNRRPGFVEPHQPRLDWQMWFAALSTPDQNPWFEILLEKLLLGEPSVTRLFDKNPFAARPPRHLRAILYEYHFSTAAERSQKGNWWRRTALAYYIDPVSLSKP